MYQPIQHGLNERINDFITRKTAPKNLSQIIVERLAPEQEAIKPRRGLVGYEVLPINNRF